MYMQLILGILLGHLLPADAVEEFHLNVRNLRFAKVLHFLFEKIEKQIELVALDQRLRKLLLLLVLDQRTARGGHADGRGAANDVILIASTAESRQLQYGRCSSVWRIC